jgi:hypothetical protein
VGTTLNCCYVDSMQISVRLIDNFTFISHHLRPDIPKPRISIVTRKSEDKRITMMPFAPGIPELYDCVVASSIKHNIQLDNLYGSESGFYSTKSEFHGVYLVWNVSKVMIQDIETELGLSPEPSKPFPLARELMQRSTPADKKEHLCSNCQSKSFELDAKTSGWKIPEDAEMGAATETTVENVVKNDTKVNRENDNGKHNNTRTDVDCNMDTSSEGQTTQELAVGRDGDILVDIAEKVMEMCAEANKVMRREERKRTRGINEKRTNQKKAAMKDIYLNKQKENKIDDNNTGNQLKTADTSGLNSTDGVLSVPRIFSTPMNDIGPKFKPQPKRYGRQKTETDRHNEGIDEVGIETASLIDSSSEPEPDIQHTTRIGEDLTMAARMVLDAGEKSRAKKKKAGKGHKQRRDMILEDPMENDDRSMKENNKKDTKIPSGHFISSVKSDPDATSEYQDGSQLRRKYTPSSLVDNSCARLVQHKNDTTFNSSQDQDPQSTHDRTDLTMWTPDESSLRSCQTSPDITAEQLFSRPTSQETIQLAILEILKEVARGL